LSNATVRLNVVWSVKVVAPSRPNSTGSIARIAHKSASWLARRPTPTQLLVVDGRHDPGHYLEIVVGAFAVARDIRSGDALCALACAFTVRLGHRLSPSLGLRRGAGASGRRRRYGPATGAGMSSPDFRTDSIRGSWPRCSARTSRRFARMNAYACAARNILLKPAGRNPHA
jgi:hypothetical protein